MVAYPGHANFFITSEVKQLLRPYVDIFQKIKCGYQIASIRPVMVNKNSHKQKQFK